MRFFYLFNPVRFLSRGFFFVCCFFLAGCGHGTALTQYRATLEALLKKHPGVNYAAAKKIPYANMMLTFRGQKAIFVLAYVVGPERQWAARDQQMFVTQKGILKRTDGMPDNLQNLQYTSGFNPYQQSLLTVTKHKQASGWLSLMPQRLFELPFQSQFVFDGKQVVTTAYGKKVLIKLHQKVVVPSIKWHYTNEFWVLPKSGRVLKSVQYFSPKLPPVTIEVVKPFIKDV